MEYQWDFFYYTRNKKQHVLGPIRLVLTISKKYVDILHDKGSRIWYTERKYSVKVLEVRIWFRSMISRFGTTSCFQDLVHVHVKTQN